MGAKRQTSLGCPLRYQPSNPKLYIQNEMVFDVWGKKRLYAYFFRQILTAGWTACMICGCQKLKAVIRVNEDMMYSEVCLTINACVSLYGTFNMFLWLINVPNGSVNIEVPCGLIITRTRIICQDD